MPGMPPIFPKDRTQGPNRLVLLVSDEILDRIKELAASQGIKTPVFARRFIGHHLGMFDEAEG